MARPRAHVREVLLHDVEVVAVGVQGRDRALGALAAIEAVVVVGGDVGDVLVAQQPHQPAGDRRLAGGGVPDDPEDDRARHLLLRAQREIAVLVGEDRAGEDVRGLDGHQVAALQRVAAIVEAAGLAHPRALDRVADAAPVREARAPDAALDVGAEGLARRGRELVALLVEHEVGDRDQLGARRSRGSGCGGRRASPCPGWSGRRSPCDRGSPPARRRGRRARPPSPAAGSRSPPGRSRARSRGGRGSRPRR